MKIEKNFSGYDANDLRLNLLHWIFSVKEYRRRNARKSDTKNFEKQQTLI